MTARTLRLFPASHEAHFDFWRRMHRQGHAYLAGAGGSIEERRRKRLHAFAGHLARSDGATWEALNTRPMHWWRFHQPLKSFVHPKRGRLVRRWEEQMEAVYGAATSAFVDDAVGWRLLAQDRREWRAREVTFARL